MFPCNAVVACGRERRQERKQTYTNVIQIWHYKYKCLIQMYKKACTCKVVVLIAILLTSPSPLLFKSSLFSRTLRRKTKSSAKPGTDCGALSARPWLLFCYQLNKAFYKSTLNIILCFFQRISDVVFFFLYYNNCSTRVKWVVKIWLFSLHT